MEQKVRILKHLEAKTGEGANGPWKVQTIVTETVSDYPKKIAVDIFNDKPTPPPVGSIGTMSCNVESREYNERYYTSCKMWKWELEQAAPIDTKPIQDPPPTESDNLPF